MSARLACLGLGLVLALPSSAWAAPAPPDDPTSRAAPVASTPPPSGAGLRAGGFTLIGRGALSAAIGAFSLSVYLESRDFLEQSEFADPEAVRRTDMLIARGAVALGLGLLEVGGGIVMEHFSYRRRRARADWVSETGTIVPADGNGLILSGSLLLGFGATDFATAFAVDRAYDSVLLSPFTITYYSAYLATGGVLLGVGLHRRKQHRAWLEQRGYVAVPFASPNRGGASFGVAGRF